MATATKKVTSQDLERVKAEIRTLEMKEVSGSELDVLRQEAAALTGQLMRQARQASEQARIRGEREQRAAREAAEGAEQAMQALAPVLTLELGDVKVRISFSGARDHVTRGSVRTGIDEAVKLVERTWTELVEHARQKAKAGLTIPQVIQIEDRWIAALQDKLRHAARVASVTIERVPRT